MHNQQNSTRRCRQAGQYGQYMQKNRVGNERYDRYYRYPGYDQHACKKIPRPPQLFSPAFHLSRAYRIQFNDRINFISSIVQDFPGSAGQTD